MLDDLYDNLLDITNIDYITYGISQKQKRSHEDCYQIMTIGPFRYYAVFDGHGGSFKLDSNHVAHCCANELHLLLAKNLYNKDYDDFELISDIIQDTFVEFDRLLYNDGKQYGSTCTMVLIDDLRQLIYQVNLGDSRSIIFSDVDIGSATIDHKPNNINEKSRILKAGGRVYNDRVDGRLSMSRSFGDWNLKRITKEYEPIFGRVSSVPDIKVILIPDYQLYLVLSSDAPFDYDEYDNQTLTDLFKPEIFDLDESLTVLAREIVEIIDLFSTDDITIIVTRI